MARVPAGVLAAAAVALGVSACGGDDPTGPVGDALSQAEAEIMMEALAEAGGLVVGGFGGQAAPARAPFGPVTVDETMSCPDGGTIAVSGSFSGESNDDGTGTVEYDFTQIHQGCRATADADGSVWTFDGDPEVTVDMLMAVTETSFDLDGTQSGAVSWANGDRSGTCQIDVTYAFSGSESGQTFSGSVSGTVCGHQVSESVSVDG